MLLTTFGQQLDNIDMLTYTSYVGAPLPFFKTRLFFFRFLRAYICLRVLFCLLLCDLPYDMVMEMCTVFEIAKYIGLSEGTVSIELRYSE